MYIGVYNSTAYYSANGGDVRGYPDPHDPSTYDYTTADTEDSHINIPGEPE
jgi:hypothetical protein